MGIRAQAMHDKVKVTTVEWEDETVDIGYYPGRYTPDLVEQITDSVAAAESAATKDQAKAALETLEQTVTSVLAWWDVLDENDERLPVTPAVIATLPLAFVKTVMETVGEATRPPASRG